MLTLLLERLREFTRQAARQWLTRARAYAHIRLIHRQYMATKELLAPMRPVAKFLCVKAVLFFSYWQGVVLVGLVEIGVVHAVGVHSTAEVATGLQDMLICVEMLPFAILHHCVFGWREFEHSSYRVRDARLEPNTRLRQRGARQAVVSGLRDAVRLGDVLDDARVALRPMVDEEHERAIKAMSKKL